MGFLPFSNFVLMNKENPTIMFTTICKALQELDVDYFTNMAVEHHQGFLWHVTLTYDKTASLKSSLDFANFPILKRISEIDLGHEERKYARNAKRDVSKEPAKLCDMFTEEPTYLYTENLLFLLLHQSCTVSQVHRVCAFRQEQFLDSYLTYLQIQRGKTNLKIVEGCCKSLGNNLAGEKTRVKPTDDSKKQTDNNTIYIHQLSPKKNFFFLIFFFFIFLFSKRPFTSKPVKDEQNSNSHQENRIPSTC